MFHLLLLTSLSAAVACISCGVLLVIFDRVDDFSTEQELETAFGHNKELL